MSGMPAVETTVRRIEDLLTSDGYPWLECNGNLHEIDVSPVQLQANQLEQVLRRLGTSNNRDRRSDSVMIIREVAHRR